MRIAYLFLLFSVNLFAQETASSNGKWSLGITASPDYCYHALTSDNSTIGNYIVSHRNSYDLPQYGFTGGFQACYAFSKHFSFEFGINYMNKGYKTKPYNNFIPPTPIPDPSIPLSFSYQYRYHYIGVPLLVNYTAGQNRFKFIASLGVIPYIITDVRSTDTRVFTDSTVVHNYSATTGLKRINMAAFASAGVETQLSPRFKLRTQPIFRINSDVFDKTAAKEHLWAAGLNVGLYYMF